MGIELRPRYGLLTLAYMLGIYWLSSLPRPGAEGNDLSVQLAFNVLHIPLYAGLTFCLLRTVWRGRGRRGIAWGPSGLTFLVAGVYAVLDEWHQSFVPGRSASVGDFLLDLLGIGSILVVRRPPGAARDRRGETSG